MQVVHEVCCGLDVHKKSVTACVLWASGRRRQTREFGTFTRELFELGDWMRACGVTHVALESTGVYWKPVWNLLEGQFEVLLVNAQHIKAVPGRKTDQKDSEWIADLLQHGLLRASFVPPTPIRELRDLTRYRASLAQEINRIANRIRDHCVSSVPFFFPGAADSTVKMLHLSLPVTVTQLPRAVPKHGRNQRAEPYYREYRADCVQTMPAITQQRPICWRGFGCRCPHPDVDRIDEDGPYKQHPCETKQPSQGESEYRAPSASKKGHHQGREECSNLDSSDPLPPVAIKR